MNPGDLVWVRDTPNEGSKLGVLIREEIYEYSLGEGDTRQERAYVVLFDGRRQIVEEGWVQAAL